MKKICKQCGAEIKGKPKILDDYYFCPKLKDGEWRSCAVKWINEDKEVANPQPPQN